MSVEFRQRKPGEYLNIIRKRKWLIILPMIALTTAVAYVVYRLPDIYESTTLIVVTSSTLPTNVVPTATEDSITRQLSSINQIVASRSSLEPLVQKYDLYKSERLRGEAIESVIAMMRKDINVEVNTSRNDITNGFNITFRGRDPKTTQAVTSELASKYIDEQTKDTSHRGQSAKEFMNNQVLTAKQELDAIDKKRLDFMTSNSANLPSGSAALISQLTGLREQQKAVMVEIGRLQDQRAANITNLALIRKNTEQQKTEVSETTTDPKTTLAWSQLVTRKAQLEGELTRLKQELRDKHPDVIAKQKEIDQVQKDMDDMIAEWKQKIEEKEKKLESRPDLQAAAVENSIKAADGEIKRQQQILADNEKAIGSLVERLNNIPGVEVQLGAIEREYETKKAAYDQLLGQQTKINLGADAASQQQSEGIAVVDPANLPSKPVAPKRLMLSTIGLALGLALGLVLTAAFEVPRLLTIQTTEDVRHYTGLPVLISVPELLTAQEARAVPRRRRLLLAAGMAVTIVSIPLIALALKLTHIFELLMQSSGRS
ncbi:MAG TPA: Wzz/FepE/Etk N-terminal domain-containing protein [Pyrinomonadaceae bacterium]|jgi:polysaccharide chain length determinant protein (PEP-CTERM system associated)